jgi:hypothetical protein
MMGVANAELWNNLGLCCFYASQYDMTFRCFENALLVADDATQADVWCAPSVWDSASCAVLQAERLSWTHCGWR